ncbi:MAG: hypothetical protein IJY93_04160 [Clostridia bacterium]|nr:hypothetical protein [Clostridia bacterium]
MGQNTVQQERLARFKANAESKGVQTSFKTKNMSDEAKVRLGRFQARVGGITTKEILGQTQSSQVQDEQVQSQTPEQSQTPTQSQASTQAQQERLARFNANAESKGIQVQTQTQTPAHLIYRPHDNINPLKTYNPSLSQARTLITPEHSYADRIEIEKAVEDYNEDHNHWAGMVNEAVMEVMEDSDATAQDYGARKLAEQTEWGRRLFMLPSVIETPYEMAQNGAEWRRQKQREEYEYYKGRLEAFKKDLEVQRDELSYFGEVFDLVFQGENLYSFSNSGHWITGNSRYDAIRYLEGKVKDYQEKVDNLRYIEAYDMMDEARADPEFEKYAEIGSKAENPRLEEKRYTTVNNTGYFFDPETGEFPDQHLWNHLTDEEKKVHDYFLGKYATEGEPAKALKTVNAFLDAMEPTVIARMDGAETDFVTNIANKAPATASIISIATSLGSAGEYVADLPDYFRSGRMDTNEVAQLRNTIRGTVSQKAHWEIAGWDAGAFLYNAAMSGADSLTASLVPGGSVILGLSAAAQGTNDALARGMSDDKAFWNGIVSGTLEGVFESVSIGNLKTLKTVDAKTVKDVSKNIAKSMLVNASEETCTEIANIVYDTLVNGEFAEYTLEELKNLDSDAWVGVITRIASAAGSGALMGFGFSGGSAIINAGTSRSPSTKPKYDFGVTQNDIDSYVAKSATKENTEDHKKYAYVSDRLVTDVGGEIDINGYVHVLRDNDIRHIINSHGEKTNEKYPVTLQDIAQIPNIIENYDKVYTKTNANGKPGIVYVKVGADDVVYYVEAVTTEYHGEKMLVNKQMIKTGIDTIPNLHGLEAAINKKESSSQYLADLQEIRKAYVQDVKENHSDNSIPQNGGAVNIQKDGGHYAGAYASSSDTNSGTSETSPASSSSGTAVTPQNGETVNDVKSDNDYLLDELPIPEGYDDVQSFDNAMPYSDLDGSLLNDGSYDSPYSSFDGESFFDDGMNSGSSLSDAEYEAQWDDIMAEFDKQLSDPKAVKRAQKAAAKADQAAAKANKGDAETTQPKVRAKTIFERKGMLPTAAEQSAQTKAEAAKNETARTGYLAGATKEQIYIAEQLSKYTSKEIIFVSDNYVANGEFDGKNTILVNPKRGNVVSQVIAHELTHAVEGTKEYAQLVDGIKGFLETYSAKGVIADWDTFRDEVYAEYEHKYKELTGEDFDDAKADREVVARVMETLFGEGDTMTERQIDLVEFVKHNRNAFTRMWYRLSQMAKRMREDIADFLKRGVFKDRYDATYREHQLMLREIERIRDRFGRALVQAKGKDGTGERAMMFADEGSGRAKTSIVPNMDESKRAEIIRKTKLDVVSFTDESAELSRDEVLKLKNTYKSEAGKVLRTLGEKFGIFDVDYTNENIELEFGFDYSKRSLAESVHKQNERANRYKNEGKSVNFYDFAKMMYVFRDVVENAQPIEAHTDKYIGTKRESQDLKQVYVLMSAFRDGTQIIPVEFSIKEFNKGKNKLYVSVTLKKIEADLMEIISDPNNPTNISKSTSTYSLSQIIENVNPLDEDLLRYIPDELLSSEQLAGKRNSQLRDNERLADMRYEKAAESDYDRAIEMLREKRMSTGYSGKDKVDDITYDDDGTLIPLSKRYDKSKSDPRFSFGNADTVARNEAEARNREEALSMYRRMRDEQRRQEPNALTAEDIYNQTGWYYDEFGNFVVDHDAPVYAKDMTDNEKARSYVEYAHKYADFAEAESAQVRSENIALREDVAKWQARAEAAEKAARIIERDAAARIASDRQLSPDYMPSKKQVKGIITELGDMLGGGFSAKQINDFTTRLLDIYDSIGMNVRDASELTKYSKEISDLISDMQDVRLENTDNAYIAERLRTELKTPLYLSQKARGDISGGYGSTARKYRGKVNLTTKEKGTPVDVRYMELSTLYPDWFSPEIVNESEQLARILEVSDQVNNKDFTSRERYADVGADADAIRTSDFGKAMLRILDGYNEVESVPRTLADGLMRQIEFQSREHQRELARTTEEVREKLEAEQKQREEALMREAEEAYLQELRAKAQRKHDRGGDIKDAAIKAARDDGSFTAKMTEVYERFSSLEDEIARIEAECKRHERVDTEILRDKSEKQYIKDLRERRDALIEKKSNLEAYINKVNARVKDIRFKAMCDMIAKDRYFADWKNKAAPLLYSIETMRRNVQAIAPKNRDSALAKYIIEELLDPITSATYMTTVVRNEVRDRVKALGLSRKVKKGDFLSESQFVQAYGEAVDNIKALESGEGSFIYNKRGEPMREGMTAQEWRGYLNRIVAENPGITKDKVRFEHMKEAVKVFKEIYDELFTVVNAARVRNGYAPVPYHRGYFPHYNNDTKQDGVFSLMLQGFGFRQQEISEMLPTSINGMTATFRPGIRYMSNANQRSMAGLAGERQVTGAVEGLDRYIEVATDVAFQTDNIQNLRALANAIRYTTTSDETKARIEKIRNDDSLTTEQKQEDINNLFASKTDKTKYALNNFVVDLEEYTNLLAGKQSSKDRGFERTFGRSFYTMMRRLTGRVASNAIVGNIGSALTNFIPLMDGGAVMHYHMLGAMWDMFKGHISDDGFISTSQFLTNRRGSQRLVRSGMDVASDVGSSAMNFVDNFTSELLMRARVRQNMSKHRGGMSYNAAMKEADTFIAGMMGDRSKGAMPTIFGAMNPLVKSFTMYQVEVKNQFGFMFRDMRLDSGAGKWLVKLMAMAILHRLFNDLYEKLVGRRPALDPLEMLNDLGGDLTGYKLASIDDILAGDLFEETEKKNPVGAGFDLITNIGKETPFIGGIMFDGGRIPTASMLPDMSALRKAFEGMVEGDDKREIAENLYKGISPVIYYGGVPIAGGQLKKGVEGANAFIKGGSYTYDKEGNRQLQYPIFTDEGANTVGEAVRTLVFGKSSTETGHEWVENGFGYLSVDQTAAYEEMVKAGEGQRESWELVQELRATNPETDKSLARLDVLMQSDVIDEAKAIAFCEFVSTSEKWPAKVEQLMKAGVGFDEFLEMYRLDLTLTGDEKDDKAMTAIENMDISDEAKATAFCEFVETGETWHGKVDTLIAAGVDFDAFLTIHRIHSTTSGYDKKPAVVAAIDKLEMTGAQKDAIYLCYYKESTLDDTPWYVGD